MRDDIETKVIVIRELPKPQPPPPIKQVVLTLTPKAAAAVLTLTGSLIGGGEASDVYLALVRAGVTCGGFKLINTNGETAPLIKLVSY